MALNLNLHALVARMNPTTRNALEAAAGLCLSRGHQEVDIEHVLLKLLEHENTDVQRILRQFEIGRAQLERELDRSLATFKGGSGRTPVLSERLPMWLASAWLLASVQFGQARIRSGHLLAALLADAALRRAIAAPLPALAAINVEGLLQDLPAITAGSIEAAEAPALAEGGPATAGGGADAGNAATGAPGATPHLDKYCTNLTQRARTGALDPVLGRDAEVRLMVDILTRRRQNNPILTGEPGVGKTAVVEGLAARIAAGDVPPAIANVELYTLDLGLLQAGASVKGEFENRLKGVIDEVKKSATPIIMFIDEAHTLIGAGGQAGQNDAANLLKPALARGEMRTIAATTWSEYKKYFEKDPALARRFQVVKVEEPDDATAVTMLRGVVPAMAAHHGVRILGEAVRDAVKLSARYVTGRQLPDKAVSVLDTACARIAITQNASPAALEALGRALDDLAAERAMLAREQASGSDHGEALAAIEQRSGQLATEREALQTRWQQEQALVRQLQQQLDAVEAAEPGSAAHAGALQTLQATRAALQAAQGELPMVLPLVDGHAVAQVIASWTGIPLGRMLADEVQTILHLEQALGERVIGQDHALAAIAQRVRTSRANLEDPNKPKGVFLLVGTSGVGKTETAIALADTLYGGERNMVTINMSEYQEAHTVSSLKGSPPGYVGYGEGGVLTEAVRRRPYSVVLLDEVEKAHPDVLELFFQVFDKGVMEDGEGREIDFRNTLILLTSNAGTDTIMQACLGAPQVPSTEALLELLRPGLQEVFKPAFLGRCTVIPYYPLQDAKLRHIARLKLGKIARRIQANHGAAFEWDEAVVEAVTARSTEVDSGARAIDGILNGGLLPQIATEVLARMAAREPVRRIRAALDAGGQIVFAIE
ncbi:type VI secretion system ATPase TssH [Corticibacter populi]|uniref:Type VI secretion system ATPase TssH n=1 Tax=Corticibacter populi TaxID=1550736 RepID=A0A3M6QME9_9BURK|nr:type VI secretion system ATPase TssH [Corticibacter populi]RMX04250.1 type VI secretion system ATPase TssH [Corticibacter populi]RZS33292.1 type VI secretion system protein VasG [Corticibacter populi]